MSHMVTVVCCTYNHENYIEQTLKGFLMQKTNFPVQYIIRDDASTDKTADVIRKYEAQYPGVFTAIYNKENQYYKEVPYFSTKVMNSTDSKYVALCEGDDYWCDENKLQKQVDAMESDESITLCLHAHYELNAQTGKKKARFPYKKTGVIETGEVFLEPYGIMPATCSMLMRTSVIREYPEDILHSPVGDRNRRMYLADQGKVYYIAEPMGVYRVNNPHSFGGNLYEAERSLLLVNRMNAFFDEFDAYTNHKYSTYISYVKEREYVNHYMRFREYEKITKTNYYKDYYPLKSKLKVLIKWKLSGVYNLYKRINKISD